MGDMEGRSRREADGFEVRFKNPIERKLKNLKLIQEMFEKLKTILKKNYATKKPKKID